MRPSPRPGGSSPRAFSCQPRCEAEPRTPGRARRPGDSRGAAAADLAGRLDDDRLTEQLLGLAARTAFLAGPPKADRIASGLAVRAAGVTAVMLAPYAAVSEAELTRASLVGH